MPLVRSGCCVLDWAQDDNKQVALGTAKINYMDPRITVAWCKRVRSECRALPWPCVAPTLRLDVGVTVVLADVHACVRTGVVPD